MGGVGARSRRRSEWRRFNSSSSSTSCCSWSALNKEAPALAMSGRLIGGLAGARRGGAPPRAAQAARVAERQLCDLPPLWHQ